MTDAAVRAPVVAIVGGGVTGLSAAWELLPHAPAAPGPGRRDTGAQVVVLEASERLGGKIRTGVLGGRPIDVGPDAFVARRPEARALCVELGLDGDLVAPGRRGAAVWARGRLRPLPAGLALGVPTRLVPLACSGICSPGAVARAALDLMRPTPHNPAPSRRDRSVGDIVGALGVQVVDRLADPLIGGIHAGSVQSMSAAAVFPPLLEAADRGGSLMRALRQGAGLEAAPDEPVFLGLPGGMERIVTALAAGLGERGVTVRTGTPVVGLERRGPDRFGVQLADGSSLEADAVIVTVPAPAAAIVLASLEPEGAELLASIDYASVALVSMRIADNAVTIPPEGTGFLVPRRDGRFITACMWMTQKWPHLRVPGEVVVRASAGRYGDDTLGHLDDDAVAGRARRDLDDMGVLRGTALETVVTRWPRSFPQYEVGHVDKVAALDKLIGNHPGLALAGAALHGVGIPACIGSGRRAAHSVLDDIGTTARRVP